MRHTGNEIIVISEHVHRFWDVNTNTNCMLIQSGWLSLLSRKILICSVRLIAGIGTNERAREKKKQQTAQKLSSLETKAIAGNHTIFQFYWIREFFNRFEIQIASVNPTFGVCDRQLSIPANQIQAKFFQCDIIIQRKLNGINSSC